MLYCPCTVLSKGVTARRERAQELGARDILTTQRADFTALQLRSAQLTGLPDDGC